MHVFTLNRTLLICLFVLQSGFSLQAQKMEGIASFYGDRFDGKNTSTGETFRQKLYSAASNDFAWGTILEVTNVENGKQTQVRVNDCGPHSRGRIIDLSKAAAKDLGFIKQGEAKVRLRVVRDSDAGPTCGRSAWAKKLKAAGKPIPPPPPAWDPKETAELKNAALFVVPEPKILDLGPLPAGAVEGMATYYADRFDGRPTSTGETYDKDALTTASKTYPYGTVLLVTNVVNGKQVEVRVNDCGPHSPERILELSRAAAARIDMLSAGTAAVRATVVKMGTDGPTCNRADWAKARQEAAAPATTPTPSGQVQPPPPTVPGAKAATTPPKTAPAKPAPAQPAPADVPTVMIYGIQVGAYGSEVNADRVVKELADKGFSAGYAQRKDNLSRVYVGKYPTEAEAEKALADVQKAGYPKAAVKEVSVPANQVSFPIPARTSSPAQATKPATPASQQPKQATPANQPTTYGSTVQPPQPAPLPSPSVPQYDPTDILFGVQIGTFTTQANADKAMVGLRAKGFTEVYSARVDKKYRVFAGKFFFQHQAEEEKTRLREAGFNDAVVRRVQ
ncbi:septal ring lytic transglycosylase RlpA family protein [Neolewinella lacunae]|uniref:Probable endolytic peptidoglycan transglycosylase RlpA n=1 Tax=Neolewinella lacunae TaxID=1517758 RepID=A0A923PH79_9BACT|nr:septal ring lytic transglycosylase RlpA family protein [Neolewinella lacunae]MBC6992661.1 septal ring lytic transglycosylase RlpA family protein [Neolewinella lacunae]MDN3633541.1 septal ring lytic transglycosylase RlpA family protein [Neolewinella lacunae]